jgi:hypothetical protein
MSFLTLDNVTMIVNTGGTQCGQCHHPRHRGEGRRLIEYQAFAPLDIDDVI